MDANIIIQYFEMSLFNNDSMCGNKNQTETKTKIRE